MPTEWLSSTVIENHHWTDQLYSLRVRAPGVQFEAGQFGRLALDINGERIARPYSFVNPPESDILEFYSIIVPEGPLSPQLETLSEGDSIWVSSQGVGFFVLSEVPESDYLWLLSTGTGLGPYLSILRTPEPWGRYRKIALIHAVRYTRELTYQNLVGDLEERYGEQFVYIPFVSREPCAHALDGRIPAAIEDGRLAERAQMDFTAERAQVMLCGNPQMVQDTSALLREMGLARNRRSAPGQITTESYW